MNLSSFFCNLPGTVLSRMNPMTPPTNMAVVRRTSKTWSKSSLPGNRHEPMKFRHLKCQ